MRATTLVHDKILKSTVKKVVKKAVKQAVKEAVQDSQQDLASSRNIPSSSGPTHDSPQTSLSDFVITLGDNSETLPSVARPSAWKSD